MTQDMAVILDLGSEESARVAREVRSLGVYSEIHPHDITLQQLSALGNVRALILNGGPNRMLGGTAVAPLPEVLACGLPMLAIDFDGAPAARHIGALPEWPRPARRACWHKMPRQGTKARPGRCAGEKKHV